MSLSQRVKQGYLRLPSMEKVIFIGSVVTMLSTAMPWYDNRNNYKIGETYLGFQGPLFVVGLLTLVFAGLCFLKIFLPFMGRNFFQSSYKIGKLSLILGLQSMLMLVIANTVFYHPDFGDNATSKAIRFGMFFAFLGVAMMITGGYLASKRGDLREETVSNYEPRSFSNPSPITTPSYSAPQSSSDESSDDARARYRALSSEARSNLWSRREALKTQAQSQNPSPFARLDSVQNELKEVSENMRIRTDL